MADGADIFTGSDFEAWRGWRWVLLRSPSELPEAIALEGRQSPGGNLGGMPDSYYSARNQFERFRWFLELISRFEFLVCSKFNHMQRDCTCACALACLHPHNSISNVVMSLDDSCKLYIKTYKRCSKKKKHETIVEGQRLL